MSERRRRRRGEGAPDGDATPGDDERGDGLEALFGGAEDAGATPDADETPDAGSAGTPPDPPPGGPSADDPSASGPSADEPSGGASDAAEPPPVEPATAEDVSAGDATAGDASTDAPDFDDVPTGLLDAADLPEPPRASLADAPTAAMGLDDPDRPGGPSAGGVARPDADAGAEEPVPAPARPGFAETLYGTGREPAAADEPTTADDVEAAGDSGSGAGSGARGPGTGDGGHRSTRILFWVAAGLLFVLILLGLFLLGTRLPSMLAAPAPAPHPSRTASTPSPTRTPSPTPTPTPTGPQQPGVHAWDTLRGGECLEPFTSPWEQKFTVVDCASPHTAQLVYRGTLPGDADAAYPGEDALSAKMNVLCTAPGVIDLKAAAKLSDLQFRGTFPATEAQWEDGDRSYFCFVSRSSGDPITGSLAGPGPE